MECGTFQTAPIWPHCGPIETATILEVARSTINSAAQLSEDGASLTVVNAPVSGGPIGALADKLTLMAGTDTRSVFAQVKEILGTMGVAEDHTLWEGESERANLMNDYKSKAISLSAMNAHRVGGILKMGLEFELLTDVNDVSGGQCWVMSKSISVPDVQASVPSSRELGELLDRVMQERACYGQNSRQRCWGKDVNGQAKVGCL